MPKQTVINKDTLVPLSIAILIITGLLTLSSVFISELSKVGVQAAEIRTLQKDYTHHKRRSIEYFLSISKSLSRIEGKLETDK